MAYTDPKTFAVSEILTAGEMNTYVRDNVKFLARTPQVAVRLTSTQSVAASSDALVSWDETVWDDDAMWDVGTPGSIVIPRPGIYSVVVNVLWPETTTEDVSRRAVFLEKNGTSRLAGDQRRNAQPTEQQVILETNLAADDYLELVARQTYSSSLLLQPTRTRMTVRWVALPPAV